MKLKLLFTLLTIYSLSNAQTPSWQWAKSAGRYTSQDGCNGIATDLHGYSYITGSFQDTIDFGNTTLINTGTYNSIMYFAKYDSLGNIIWAKKIGGNNRSDGNGICTDKNGNFYITGVYNGTIDFGITSFSASGWDDMFTAKFDSAGNAVWAQRAICGGAHLGKSINVANDGSVYVTGSHEDNAITFGSYTLPIFGFIARDIFLVKYDNTGNVVWAKGAGDANLNNSGFVCTDESGNIYITGDYRYTISFDTINLVASNNGSASVYTAKYDPNGNVLWAKSSGGFPCSGYGRGVSADAKGNCYVTGMYNSPIIYFDGDTITNVGINDIFVLRYDVHGNLVWLRGVGSTNFDEGKAIRTDANGNSFVTGNFRDVIHFGSTTLYPSSQEIFVSQFDSSGNILWALQSAGSLNELGNAISIDDKNNIYISGIFSSPTSTFGSTTLTNSDQFLGSYDLLLAKINAPLISFVENNISGKTINVIPNPFSEIATLKFENAIKEKLALEIYDSKGQIIRIIQNIIGETVEINRDGLSQGLYFFRLFSTQKTKARGKLIVD